ncbi:Zinc finger protein DZIP1L [Amphibalanus amphitrite]|uniref:Zinc finger protein DZIP1L n=1 Tax=Amphibalanus amphitrite TaxID=1232801 RepID=A0A6A4X269_AMPAM|nr:Zinc finger protein DZIP1L [Amphibalanus amphitrite]
MDRPNFHFRRREEKLDWKKLAALDVDQIAKTVDYKALQDSIRQITYCDAGKEFDSEAADPNLVKVFRMAQLIIEYLLQSQDFLANNLASVEERLNSTLEELESARQRSRRDQEELRELRKGLRAPASSTVMTLTGHQRCQFCQKVFINTTYLQSHMMRRHNHMVGKQMSNQTLSTVIQDQVRRRLLVAEQQLREERRRVAALEQPGAGAYQPDEAAELAPYHHTIKEEPEPPPEEPEPAGSRQDSGSGSRQGSGGGSRHGSGGGSRQGSGGGSRHGSGGGSRQGSGGGSRHGSGGGSRQGSGGGSRQDSGGASRQGSGSGGGGSQRGSGGGSAEQKDSRLAVLLEQQAAEIRQLREELERQRQTMPAAPAAPTLLGGAGAEPPAPTPEPVNRVEQEIQKQARRDVVALEGQMEAQERYWQERLSAMRQRHDAEVEGMRRMLNEKNAATRGSAEYVNLDSGAERSPQSQSPRLLRFVHRHQSPSPGPAAAPGPAGRGGRQRPRPCIAPQPRHGRSRSVSGCRRLKFADDEEECDDDDEPMVRAAPRQSLSTDALTRNGPAGGRPQVRQELESELSERLLELGIEPGTRRLSSGLMTDKMRHLQMTRQVKVSKSRKRRSRSKSAGGAKKAKKGGKKRRGRKGKKADGEAPKKKRRRSKRKH